MFGKALGLLMVLMIMREAPGVTDPNDKRLDKRRVEVKELAALHIEVAKKGQLVDPLTDAAILTGISFYESRHMLKPKDGDARFNWRTQKSVGTVVGPMQVSKAAPRLVKIWPEPWRTKWKGLTVKKMRDPKTNIALAYDILKMWKDMCGGPPGVWVTAYGWGRCPKYDYTRKHKYVDWEGRRRCKLITQTMERLAKNPEAKYDMPEKWYCGHEKYPTGRRTR
jgi:hypothetical protein